MNKEVTNSTQGANNTSEADDPSQTMVFPMGWDPSRLHVICRRGSSELKHVGNRWYKALIAESIPMYQEANTKLEKSIIVDLIWGHIQQREGGFVRWDDQISRWIRLPDEIARQKIGASLRRRYSGAADKVMLEPGVGVIREFREKHASLLQYRKKISSKGW